MTSEDFRRFLNKYKLSKQQAMHIFGFKKTTYHKYTSPKYEEEISNSVSIICECLDHMGKGKAKRYLELKLSTHRDKSVRKLLTWRIVLFTLRGWTMFIIAHIAFVTFAYLGIHLGKFVFSKKLLGNWAIPPRFI